MIHVNITNELLASVKENEGFRHTVYKDSLGFETIGYGSAIKDLYLEQDLAEQILIRALFKKMQDCHKRFSWLEEQPTEVKDIVYEMCYQLGVTGFSKFKKTINYIIKGDYEAASVEMLDSRWASQTRSRAKKLSDKMKQVG